MMTCASVLIMDVTDSGSFSNMDLLTQYLVNTESWLQSLARRTDRRVSVVHRFGDEILLVAQGYGTAYLIALYLMMTWRYADRYPYFGMSFGDTMAAFPSNDNLNGWNSPLVKHARNAIDKLKAKRSSQREWMRFESTDLAVNDWLNDFVMFQGRFLSMQKPIDRVVSMLYTILGTQEAVSDILDRNPSTISRQVRRSNIDLIMAAKRRVLGIISSTASAETVNEMETVEASIVQSIQDDFAKLRQQGLVGFV